MGYPAQRELKWTVIQLTGGSHKLRCGVAMKMILSWSMCCHGNCDEGSETKRLQELKLIFFTLQANF